MKLELTSTRTNPLFGRREVSFKIDEPTTPSRSQIKIELAVALRVDLNQVYVRNIETKSGTHETLGMAHVYDDPENALKVEPKHVIERNKSVPVEEKAEE